jgi:hypothetical protein
MVLSNRLVGEATLTTIPSDQAQPMASEIDRLIGLADSYEDFVLGALLCAARDHLEHSSNAAIPPSP